MSPGIMPKSRFSLPAKEPRMAGLLSFRHSTVILLLGLMLLVGCQTQTSMVGELPSPNFGGPVAMQTTPRQTVIVPRLQVPPTARLQPRIAASVPRDWTPPAAPRLWQAIVIHHSATPAGGAMRFDREHREKG